MAEGPHLQRQLSVNSEEILSSLSTSLGGGATAKALLADALLAIKAARDSGEISDEEKAMLKRQLLAGKGYDDDLLGKLSPTRQLTLMKEMNKRVVLNEVKVNEKLECPICTERYSPEGDLCPHMLPCGHSICFRCLQDLTKMSAAQRLCPLDRRPLSADISQFPLNYSLLAFLTSESALPLPVPASPLDAGLPPPLARAPQQQQVQQAPDTQNDEIYALMLQNELLNEEPLEGVQSSTGLLAPGARVVLTESYAEYTDAAAGPLSPRDVGTILRIGQLSGGRATYQVEFSGRSWWYQPQAIAPETVFVRPSAGVADAGSGRVVSDAHVHPLAPTDARRRQTARCDICKKLGSCAYYCLACDFDVCDGCYATKNVRVGAHEHMLFPCSARRRTTARCDLCRQRGSCAYFCESCDWDICDACFTTHKALGGAAHNSSSIDVGSRVRIKPVTIAAAKAKMAGNGGWVENMAKALGNYGTVTSKTGNTMSVRMEDSSTGSWTWNQDLIELAPAGGAASGKASAATAGTAGGHILVKKSFQCPTCGMNGPSYHSSDMCCNACRICAVCCSKRGSMCTSAKTGAVTSTHTVSPADRQIICRSCNFDSRSAEASYSRCIACSLCSVCCAKSPVCASTSTSANSAQGTHPGCAARRAEQLGDHVCNSCGGRFKKCFGNYGHRDEYGKGTWRSGSCPANLAHSPESPNTSWCTIECEVAGTRGPDTRIAVGTKVVLSADFANHGDAALGPLHPGDVASVLVDDRSLKPYKIEFSGHEWWYEADAIVPAPETAAKSAAPAPLNANGFAGGHVLVEKSFKCKTCGKYGPSSQTSKMCCSVCSICAVCCSKRGSICTSAKTGAASSTHTISTSTKHEKCSKCSFDNRSSEASYSRCVECSLCSVCCTKSPICMSMRSQPASGHLDKKKPEKKAGGCQQS